MHHRAVALAAVVLLAVVALASCASYYRSDRSEQRHLPARDVMTLLWHHKLVADRLLNYKPQEWASAAITDDGKVLLGSSARRFVAVAPNGHVLWHVNTEGTISSRPWYDASTRSVYFGADDGHMYAVDADSGQVRWKYATQGTIIHPPVHNDGVLLFTSSEDRIYAVDAGTGKWRWQYDRERPEGFTIQGFAGPLIDRQVVFTGFSDGVVVALKPATGEVIWTRALGSDDDRFTDVDATPIIVDGMIVVTSYSSGVYALDPDTGSVRWHFPLSGAAALAAANGRVFATAPQAGLVALDTAGRQLWRQAIPRGVPSAPQVAGPYVLVTATESGLYVAAAQDGQLLQVFDPGRGISASVATGAGLAVVLSNRGHAYAFALQ